MKILIIDHNFGQDIDALIYAASENYDFKMVSPWYFASRARKYFPDAVFSGLAEYHKPVYEVARRKWAQEAKKALQELYYVFPFDVIISPSDTFFYIRNVVKAASESGIPFVVVQKETTISPDTMRHHSREISKFFPFISDYMTVCSDRHKNFWLAAGAPRDKIEVTSQPRFDFYRQPERWTSWKELGIALDATKETILFFSYDLDAYVPVEKHAARTSWKKLREETEDTLGRLAKEQLYNLLVKPHPQQDPQDVEKIKARLQDLSGNAWLKTVHLLEREFDTRQLIVNSDIIVAFQTTALLEALIAGKDVIYTYWADEGRELEDALIPYHKHTDIMKCVRSPKELRDYLLSAPRRKPDVAKKMRKRLTLFEEHLGRLDGKAAQRVLRVIVKVVAQHPRLTDEQKHQREVLLNDRYRYCRKEEYLAQARLLWWSLLAGLAFLLKWNALLASYRPKIARRVHWQSARIAECRAAIGHSPWRTNQLVGRLDENYMYHIRTLLSRVLRASYLVKGRL